MRIYWKDIHLERSGHITLSECLQAAVDSDMIQEESGKGEAEKELIKVSRKEL